MADAGMVGGLAFWVGGGGGAVPAPLVVPPAPDPTLATTQALLARMLLRLPPSLWDTDPESPTLQRDLYRALAAQCARWLEQREIARQMTLLREAASVDLTYLLEDYGLKRYLQRPDAYARQIALQILWTPKGTQYAIDQVADLLFDEPHATLRTGIGHVHVFLAQSQPITTPYSYWGMVSQDGLWYAVTVQGDVPVISLTPPPGLDLSPGLHTLTWFTALDASGAPWYVSIAGDTLVVGHTQPPGSGTTEPFVVRDGTGQQWRLAVDAGAEALVTVLDASLEDFGYWRLVDAMSVPYALWIEGEVPVVSTGPPAGAVDKSPGGVPVRWIPVLDTSGVTRYTSYEGDTLVLADSPPPGAGAPRPFEVLDAAGQFWRLEAAGDTLVTRNIPSPLAYTVLSPGATYDALRLRDSAGTDWWLSVVGTTMQVTPTLPLGATNATPPGGPWSWLRAHDATGGHWYVYPDTAGVLQVSDTSPGGLGTAAPEVFGDAVGIKWHYGVVDGDLVLSSAPLVNYGGASTTLCLHDAGGTAWFWRVRAGQLEWSRVLWPDSLDQSPWGELAWVQALTTESDLVSVYPTRLGVPTATVGIPPTGPWGWPDPVRFVDKDGQGWVLRVQPTSAFVGVWYWQLRNASGATVFLCVQGETLAVFDGPPSGGVDRTPVDGPFDWFTVYDPTGVPRYGVVSGETLVLQETKPLSQGTPVSPTLLDSAGTLWHVGTEGDTLTIVTEGNPWLVDVIPDAVPTLPLPPGTLNIREAVEAINHVQAAGSLTTVHVS